MSSVNVLHILRTIKDRAAISRTDLQQVTGLSWGTITNTTRELLNRNLIREQAVQSTRAGRKPVKLAINPESHSLVGVDVASDVVHCLVLNLAGETLWEETQLGAAPPHADAEPPAAVLDRVADMVQRAMASPEVTTRICLGVGVSLPGAVDVRRGVLRFAPNLPGWRDVPVREHLQARLSAAVRIEHDPNCLALAERWFGDASLAENVLCIHLGVGVGMGILLGGDVFRGSQQMAGEFGHITLDPSGPPCACGDRGCVEAYCSLSAIVQYAKTHAAAGSAAAGVQTIDELTTLAKAGDAGAAEAFARAGAHLGIGLANLVDLFNPDLIVLAGPLTAASSLFQPSLDAALDRHAWRHSTRRLLISRLPGERGKAMGACGLGLHAAFTSDILPEVFSA
jgi:predicted NBD/HSP70 family sugar kinase